MSHQYHNAGFTLSLEKSTKNLTLRLILYWSEESPETVQVASWPHNLYKRTTKGIYGVCVNTNIRIFSLFFFSATSWPLKNNFLGMLAADICMDFSIAGCVKGDRLFVFTLEKNCNRPFLSEVGRDMWQRGPAHLYRQTCCRPPQIDHQLGSNSLHCRFTIILALCGSVTISDRLMCSSERRRWLQRRTWRSWAGCKCIMYALPA